MSDYFGSLMNLSGLAGAPRPAMAAAEPAAGNDIVESDVVRETPAGPAFVPPPRGAPPAASGTTAGEVAAAPAAQLDHSPAQATAAGETQRPLPPHTEPARPIAPIRVAPPVAGAAATTTTTVARDHAIVRAAWEWVAADPQNLKRPAVVPDAAPISEPSAAAPPTREERAAVIVEEAGFATTRASLRADAVPPVAQVVRVQPPAPGRSAAAPVADEIDEISIGSIHVRVDAPAPQTTARAAPAAVPASPSLSERAAGRSALARRALRRI